MKHLPRRRTALILVLVATFAATGFGVAWVWSRVHTGVRLPAAGVAVRLQPGWSFRRVARRLEQRGVVTHAWLFEAVARWRREDRRVRAGRYRFEGAPAMLEVLAKLRSRTAGLRMVTVPEGLTASELIAVLARAGLGEADAFECQLRSARWLRDLDLPITGVEGYLFPDTYAFSRHLSPRDILETMIARYRLHAARLSPERVRSGLSEHQMVTLASLIEKETGAPAERTLVSAVFHNRLHRGMRLQSDPTTIYGSIGFTGAITKADLENPSPYNTYLHTGLPPGPICNPGLAALEAALRPADAGYLYFVSRGDGTHQFSTTLAEHNRAVTRYRRGRDDA